MKKTILATLLGASIAAVPAMAEVAPPTAPAPAENPNATLIEQVSKDVKANPASAADIVKAAILKSKASGTLVAQIVKSAIVAAPGQVHAIYNASVAVAPDAQRDVNLMIVAMLGGDEVAQETVTGPGGVKFSMPSDLSVDDHSKLNMILAEFEQSFLTAINKDSSNPLEVKLEGWDFYWGGGFADPGQGLPTVVIVPRDTQLYPVEDFMYLTSK